MSYNGSGTFNINTAGQPVVAGTIISAATFNALTADLATGLTTALTKDGQTTATARIPFAQGISSTLVTDASSVSTGSIITAGGVGIAKKLYVGTDANIAGTLLVTGVTTYSNLTASSAVATDASKNLVSVTNTGTGSNVLATAPTIASANLTTALTLAGAAGTNGQVLTSAGSGLPSWTTPSVAALTLLSTVTASNSSTVDIESTFSSTYDKYVIEATNITLATNGQELYGRMKVGGSYATSNYLWRLDRSLSSGSDSAFAQRTTTSSGDGTIFDVCSAISNSAGMSADFTMHISNPAGTTNQKMVYWEGVSNTGSAASNATGQALNTATTALTGIRFLASSGNILTGTFRLYGIANS